MNQKETINNGANVVNHGNQIDKEKKIADFMVKASQPYDFKRRYAAIRAREFAEECERRGLNYHVSVGGLDSITLFLFLKSIGIYAPGISVSYLEDKSIQKIHKALGIISLPSSVHHVRADGTKVRWSKQTVIQELGFPVISKEVARKIETLANPTDQNKRFRHSVVAGGEYRNTKIPKKWLKKFAGYANDEEGTDYAIAPFKVSAKCCYFLKEKPCAQWANANNSMPYLGMMASEGGIRARGIMTNGCNYFGTRETRSLPFAIFNRDDILRLALEMDELYKTKWKDEFYNSGVKEGRFSEKFQMPESIIPEIYGTIERREDGTLYTTKAQRTGCQMCGFGVHLEERPNRFDRMKQRNPRDWEYWMFNCVVDESTGERYGWSKVLDYIGVEWRDADRYFTTQEVNSDGV